VAVRRLPAARGLARLFLDVVVRVVDGTGKVVDDMHRVDLGSVGLERLGRLADEGRFMIDGVDG
jgi:hypothetical protein